MFPTQAAAAEEHCMLFGPVYHEAATAVNIGAF